MFRVWIIAWLLFTFLSLCTGCSHLLPSALETSQSPWKTFDEARAAYDQVIPNQTTIDDFKDLCIDLNASPNIRILSYLDIAVLVQPMRFEELDEGLRKCLRANNHCRAFEFSPANITQHRYGNFWLDFFNFRRKTKETGWRFKALFVLVDDLVVYKVWSGNPHIEEYRQQTNPLGPLQDSGGIFLKFVF